jgi:hypothetical protein
MRSVFRIGFLLFFSALSSLRKERERENGAVANFRVLFKQIMSQHLA